MMECRLNARYTDKVSFPLPPSFGVFVAAFISIFWNLPNNGGKSLKNLENRL